MAKKGSPYEKFVASVVGAMDQSVHVEHGLWVDGPDGKRDMDVLVRGSIDKKDYTILIECKDYDPNTTGKVGIEYVDALDSKRRDLNIDLAMICSNSGFTQGSLRKAKRLGIGLISVLKSGDQKVKVAIKEEIYTRMVGIGDLDIHFRGHPPSEADIDHITYQGLKVKNWVFNQISLIVFFNPTKSDSFNATYNFKSPVTIDFSDTPYEIEGIDFEFHVKTKWLSQILEIDASMGIYDYLRGKVKIGGPGPVSYIVKDYNPYNGAPIDFVPDNNLLGAGIRPGEVDMEFMVIEMGLPDIDEIPKLDELIVPEDLELRAKDLD